VYCLKCELPDHAAPRLLKCSRLEHACTAEQSCAQSMKDPATLKGLRAVKYQNHD
jgi:hypothetical protein